MTDTNTHKLIVIGSEINASTSLCFTHMCSKLRQVWTGLEASIYSIHDSYPFMLIKRTTPSYMIFTYPMVRKLAQFLLANSF